jgi:DNA polymerase-3 subunit alpha
MKQMLMNLKPSSLEDLTAATSLYRPGPASQIDTFVENSKNKNNIKYETPMLEPILKNTYGCMVYQEQVMQIFRDLAGYSYGRADVVRRAMSKKKHDVMEQERETFIAGCAKNNISSQIANNIFNKMTDFASYAFNKSHAACYALVAYRCAYLKYYYPADFMAALLTSVLDSSNKVARYIAECKRLGIRLAPPNINTSMKGFTANGNVINYGLLGIKNLGNDFIEDIIKERQKGDFVNLFDFCDRMQNSHFNRRAVESLIRCGALDCFGSNRRQMLQGLPVLATNIEEKHRQTMYGQVGFFDINDDFGNSFDLPDVNEFSKSELLQMEKEMTGLYLSGHPMDKYDDFVKKSFCANTYELLEVGKNQMSQYKDGSNVNLCGIITHITVKQTRTNKANMAFVTLEDLYGTIEVILFPKTFLQYQSLIADNNVIAVSGTLSVEEEKDPKILVNTVCKPNLSKPLAKPAGYAYKQKEAAKQKRTGLFLKFDSANDVRINVAKAITQKNRGTLSLYFYYADTKKYALQPKECYVDVNDNMLFELKQILSDKNVAVIL